MNVVFVVLGVCPDVVCTVEVCVIFLDTLTPLFELYVQQRERQQWCSASEIGPESLKVQGPCVVYRYGVVWSPQFVGLAKVERQLDLSPFLYGGIVPSNSCFASGYGLRMVTHLLWSDLLWCALCGTVVVVVFMVVSRGSSAGEGGMGDRSRGWRGRRRPLQEPRTASGITGTVARASSTAVVAGMVEGPTALHPSTVAISIIVATKVPPSGTSGGSLVVAEDSGDPP
ncbi:hypothetical protein Taro_046960 [Colocasia esculenta]|uniref:Uncharacterized protein n=1 Tax=Colocasia esculenta TaxID=4460 RepID=A0A843WTX1_COLES|nr:hypothetical protein [Colocasia esculenta]